ncbi:hypothetical protein DdX_16107 [Ditylenchus destructor]|uniref:Uncharacterized protein n=1 Tax=Ditylenchus destructor TaxID=166010 RepID=A0AAD4R093_9BILA|nr:hypothetical protein DdX_16107 [Ditylenchus destructor]
MIHAIIKTASSIPNIKEVQTLYICNLQRNLQRSTNGRHAYDGKMQFLSDINVDKFKDMLRSATILIFFFFNDTSAIITFQDYGNAAGCHGLPETISSGASKSCRRDRYQSSWLAERKRLVYHTPGSELRSKKGLFKPFCSVLSLLLRLRLEWKKGTWRCGNERGKERRVQVQPTRLSRARWLDTHASAD